MKTINLTQQKVSIEDLLQLAMHDSLLIVDEDGDEYILEAVDELEREIAMLGKSKKFMRFLEKRSKEKKTISIDELEKKLKLTNS